MSTMGSTGGGEMSTGGAASTGAGFGGSSFSSTGSGGGSSASSTGTFTSSAGSTGSIAFKWGDGWREAIAGTDPKILQRLGRFATPEDMWRSYTALEARMSSGELKSGKPKDATPEALAQWRKDNGIPEKPTDYDLKFDNGLVIGEEDKPVIDAFLAVAHKNDLPPAAVKEAVAWYYETAEKQTEARAAEDLKLAQAATDTLRAKFGNEYRPNLNAMQSLLDLAPAGLKESLLHGRLSDGTPIGSSPEAIEWLVGLARQVNPVGTVVPAGTEPGSSHRGRDLEVRVDAWKQEQRVLEGRQSQLAPEPLQGTHRGQDSHGFEEIERSQANPSREQGRELRGEMMSGAWPLSCCRQSPRHLRFARSFKQA